jgi:hypothetical protein
MAWPVEKEYGVSVDEGEKGAASGDPLTLLLTPSAPTLDRDANRMPRLIPT